MQAQERNAQVIDCKTKKKLNMGIGKGRSKIDLDGLKASMDSENEAVEQEDALAAKIEEFKRAKEDLEEAVKKMEEATTALNAAKDKADEVVTGISTAITNAQGKPIGVKVHPETLKALNEVCTNFVVEVGTKLMEHRDKQIELQAEHRKKLARMLEKGQGVWLSDRWMKFLVVFFVLYALIAIVYVKIMV